MPEEGPEFRVGAVVGRWSGDGHLYIAPGRLELRTGLLTGRLSKVGTVSQEGQKIELYRALLFPPWMNAHLVLRSGSKTALAGLPAWKRRRIVHALRQSRFEVQETVSLFDSGYHLAR
jgi:hypothetical protein